jgi:hypothetical protein
MNPQLKPLKKFVKRGSMVGV